MERPLMNISSTWVDPLKVLSSGLEINARRMSLPWNQSVISNPKYLEDIGMTSPKSVTEVCAWNEKLLQEFYQG